MLTPLATPLAAITKAGLESMIGQAVEGPYLEFKEDIPVSRQSATEQAKAGMQRPRDGWWIGKSIADHGRNELIEEVVAFANAQGGWLILGIEEAATGASTAIALRPLPRVVELETKFRSFLLDCIEPRLPYSAVRAIPTEADGSGLVVIEVEGSRLGPHWVRHSRKPTVRRHTECATMSMTEVHDIVLRNARRFDDVRAALDLGMGTLSKDFHEFLLQRVDTQIIAPSPEEKVRAWLDQSGRTAVAFRILLIAHEDLGIRRLNTLAGLIPPQNSVGQEAAGSVVPSREMVAIWPSADRGERFLGGVRHSSDWSTGKFVYTVRREGAVEVSFFYVETENDKWPLTTPFLAGALGCAFGIYDNLRRSSGRLHVPVEVAITVEARGNFPVTSGNDQMARMLGGTLPHRSDFPRKTASDAEDFTDIMTETAQDLLDAANSAVITGPQTRFVYLPI